MIKRRLLKQLKNHLSQKEITLLIGPRQAGKTTLLKKIESDLKKQGQKTLFLNLDIDTDAQFFSSQQKLVKKINQEFGKDKGYVFVDEIQRKLNAGIFLKGLYDRDLPYKFIVSGSGSVELKESVRESLTGRKRLFFLNTVSFSEFVDHATDYKYSKNLSSYLAEDQIFNKQLLAEYLRFGGYPRVVIEPKAEEKRLHLHEIYQSYLAKDIALLLGIQKTTALTNLIRLLADKIGSIFKYSTASNLLNISYPTLQNYLWVLENTFIIKEVKPFHQNLVTELKKAPNYYIYDLGLRNMILENFGPINRNSEMGMLFQNFIWRLLTDDSPPATQQLNYWRTKQQAEVDFILKKGNQLLPVEVKYKKLKKNTITYGLRKFIKEYQPQKAVIINLSRKEQIIESKTKIYFIPYYELVNRSVWNI